MESKNDNIIIIIIIMIYNKEGWERQMQNADAQAETDRRERVRQAGPGRKTGRQSCLRKGNGPKIWS